MTTPIKKYHIDGKDFYVKHDDLYLAHGASGAKLRTMDVLLSKYNPKFMVMASAQQSAVLPIVSAVAKSCSIPLTFHLGPGEDSQQVKIARANGATIIRHNVGYSTVIRSRAQAHAEFTGAFLVPFQLACWEAIDVLAAQVIDIPMDVKRIIVPSGSGVSLAGIATGIINNNINVDIIGYCVGETKTVEKTLNKFLPMWRASNVTLLKASEKYYEHVYRDDIILDPRYEMKCLKIIENNDLLWAIANVNI